MAVVSKFRTTVTGLALFSMLFGAGNLIYPIMVGYSGGQNFLSAMIGFLLTGVVVPLLGFLSIVLFDGDYRAFFYRIGKVPGRLLLFVCMFIIGPVIALPRIITLSYEMLQTVLPLQSQAFFSVLFSIVVFLLSYRQKKIIELLGYVITPLLLVALGITVVMGLITPGTVTVNNNSVWIIFLQNVRFGANTLDLLGIIFLGSIIMSLLRQSSKTTSYKHISDLVVVAFNAGVLSCFLLSLVYVGMGLLGLYHGATCQVEAVSLLFRSVAMMVIGSHGAIVVILAVLMACLSTAVGLAVVVAEYTQQEIFRNNVGYVFSLVVILGGSFLFSLLGLDRIILFTNSFATAIILPIVLTVMLANLAYKLFGVRMIKVPVALVTIWVVGYSLFNLCKLYC
jgi:LIVCS family branched-chain amino acid:cation transporter